MNTKPIYIKKFDSEKKPIGLVKLKRTKSLKKIKNAEDTYI